MNPFPRREGPREVHLPPAFSNHQPLGRLAALLFLSYGIYQFFWFWRNWRQLRVGHPGWRTAGLLVPFLNFWLVYDQFRRVEETARSLGIQAFRAGRVFLAWLALNLFSTAVALLVYPWSPARLSEGLSLFLIDVMLLALQILPLVYVQSALNAVWTMVDPDRPARPGFSRGELVFLLLCIFLWQMNLLAIFAPVNRA